MTPEEQELAQLEQNLKQLAPAEPSESLTERIFSAFETPPDAAPAEIVDTATPMPKPAASWAQPFAAAAAVVLIAGIVALIGLTRPSNDSPQVRFVPAHEQDTYKGSDMGDIIFTEGRQPLQAVRHQFTKSYTWENPKDGSRVEVTFPLERVRYVPVQTD